MLHITSSFDCGHRITKNILQSYKRISWLFVLLFAFSVYSCHKHLDSTPPSDQDNNQGNNQGDYAPKGALLFWTNDASMSCGVLTVKLNNGMQSNIIGYYFVAPANCVNLVGGYFYVPEGTYTYTVTANNGCSINGGTVTVIGNTCNFVRIQ